MITIYLKNLCQVFLVILVFQNLSIAQFDKRYAYPNSFASVSLGCGNNYGGFGTKAVLGYRNSGLLIGLGSSNIRHGLWYNIGGQISAEWFYTSLSYGPYPGLTDKGAYFYGYHLLLGGMINIGKPNKYFIDLGFGFFSGKFPPREVLVAFNLGFGVRLGNFQPK